MRYQYSQFLCFLCFVAILPAPVQSQELILSDGFETLRFGVGGNVSGLAGGNLQLRLNGANDLTVQTNGPFGFAQAVQTGTGYSVTVFQQPQSPDQICSLSNATGTMGNGAINNIQVTCPSTPPDLPHSPGFEFLSTVDFLFTGLDAQQTGVDPNTIQADRVSVLTGQVFDGFGNPLVGATISILNRSEFGSTVSRPEGRYEMAVNGGGELVVNAVYDGLLPAQRRAEVIWNTYVSIEHMALVALDPVVTAVAAAAGQPQLAMSTRSTDERGGRTGRMLFPAGTGLEMVMPDGSRSGLADMDFRITEYTVGNMGPMRMPGTLPATSAYTYAIELSADEALAAGATSVELSQTAWYYVDNFLNFPTGEIVPNGYYDRELGLWIADQNGRILEVISNSGGLAEVDVDGDGNADTGTALTDLGIVDSELETIAQQFNIGDSFWRIPITHFTPHDPNWPVEPPEESEEPKEDEPEPEEPDPCERSGSIIECQTRVLGEKLYLAGTNALLHYRSNRVPGFKSALTANISLTGETLPGAVPNSIEVVGEIAGTQHLSNYDSVQPEMFEVITWDRSDAFGRTSQSRQPLITKVRYYYDFSYVGASDETSEAFGATGNGTPIGDFVVEDFLETRSVQYLGLWDARGAGLGGWTLGMHHALDPHASLLYEGSGKQRQFSRNTIDTTFAYSDFFYSLSAAPDGSVLATGTSNCTRIRRFQPDGGFETIAAEASGCPSSRGQTAAPGDDGIRPTYAVEAPDGTIILVESAYHRIGRIELDGTWSPVAGSKDNRDYTGDGSPAVDATLNNPRGLAIGADGAIYFSDTFNNAIRRITVDGIIETFAGGNGSGYTGDGGEARTAKLKFPGHLDVGPDGSIYVIDQGTEFGGVTGTTRGARIRRISPEGIITTIAGDGTTSGITGRPVESGVDALTTGIDAEVIAISPSGEIYFTEIVNHIIRRITPDGTITTYAGVPGNFGYEGDGSPAAAGLLNSPAGMAIGPDGTVLVNDSSNQAVRQIGGSAFSANSNGEILIAGEGGLQVHVFDTNGLHLRTLDSLNGHVLFAFAYDAQGRLVRVDDQNGPWLTISRPDDQAISILTRAGDVNSLALDDNGYLASLTLPGGESRSINHDVGGLLTEFGDFDDNTSIITYDSLGRLFIDENSLGFSAILSGTGDSGLDVTLADVHGASSRFTTRYDEEQNKITERIAFHGGVTTTIETPDNFFSVIFEDGSRLDTVLSPDPRWGMTAPYESSRIVTLPSGLQQEMNAAVSVDLQDDDPLQVTGMTVSTTVDGNLIQTAWDSATRSATMTTAEGMTTSRTYNALGQMTGYQEDPQFDPASLSYTADGRLSQVVRGTGQFGQTYNADGRRQTVSNNAGMNVNYGYDINGRISEVTLTSGRVIGMSHDDNGRISSVTLPSGSVHAMIYNETGFLASYTASGNAPWTNHARNDGSLSGVTLPSGRTATRTFDDNQRSTGWTYPEATLVATYVPNTSRVASSTWTPTVGAAQSLTEDYDGSLLTSMNWAGVSNAQVDLRYDSSFFVAGTTLNSGTERIMTRDGDGRIIADGPFDWTRGGPRRTMTAATDGTAILEQTVNSLGLLATRTLTVNGTQVHNMSLTYRNDRRVSDIEESIAGSENNRSFVYDSDAQLSAVMSSAVALESYDYDVNGNRILVDLGAPVMHSYDIQDRLTQVGATGVTVDVDGQTVAIGADSYTYTTRGHMLSATVGGTEVTFTYDGHNRKVASTTANGTVAYVYGNPDRKTQLTAVQEPDGTWLEYYYDETGMLYSISRDGAWFYVATDHLGSPRVVADASGSIVKTIDYSAFGDVLADSNPDFELHVGFAAGLVDRTSGLVQFGLRAYNAKLGRFMTRDPLLFRSNSINLFAYVNNDPVNLIDTSGLFGLGSAPAGSVNAGWHSGLGATVEFSSDGAGSRGFCFGVGAGAGGSFGIDPAGRPETSWRIDAGLDAGIPGTPISADVNGAIKWVKCPRGSPVNGYWELDKMSPGVGAGPLSVGSEGPSVGGGSDGNPTGGLGGGSGGHVDFIACAEF